MNKWLGARPRWHPMERVTRLYAEMEIASIQFKMPYSEYIRKYTRFERELNLDFFSFYRERENYWNTQEQDRVWWPGEKPRDTPRIPRR